MKSLKTLLIGIISAIIVVSIGTLTIVNYLNTEQIIHKELKEGLNLTAQTNAKEISLWFELRRSEVEALANSPILMGGNKEQIIEYLSIESKRLTNYSAFWVSDLNGQWYSLTGTTGSIRERPYFQELLTTQKTVISDPLIGKADGKMACVVAVPIKVGGKVVAILGGNVKLDQLVQQINSIKVGQTGYATLSQMDGLMITHPKAEYVMKYNPLQDESLSSNLKEIYQRQSQGKTGIESYKLQGSDQYIAYTLVPGMRWILSITAPAEEFEGPLKSLIYSSCLTAAVILFLVIGLVFFLVRKVTRPISLLQEASEKISQGDLNVPKLNISERNELGQLAKSFDKMVSHLRQLVVQVSDSAEQVSSSSQQLSANANHSAQALNHVANTMTSVADNAEQQFAAIHDATGAVDTLSQKIFQIAAYNQDVVAEAEKTAKAAEAGQEAVNLVSNQMNQIEQTVEDSASVVIQLGHRSKEIGQIVDTISGIAGQTNLLALNAAIEAARAGEQGRGFAVVADEVRKLAEQSQAATLQISEMIQEIQKETGKAVQAMDAGKREVKIGTEVVITTGSKFTEIRTFIESLSRQIQNISSVVDDMTSDSQQIVRAVHDIEKVTQTTVQGTQNVSAATQEQLASMEEISAGSSSLSELAIDLQTGVSKFKL